MATRDLTVTYMRLRSALHRKAPGHDGSELLGAAEGGYAVPAGSPVYVEMVTDAQADIASIDSKSASRRAPRTRARAPRAGGGRGARAPAAHPPPRRAPARR